MNVKPALAHPQWVSVHSAEPGMPNAVIMVVEVEEEEEVVTVAVLELEVEEGAVEDVAHVEYRLLDHLAQWDRLELPAKMECPEALECPGKMVGHSQKLFNFIN